MSSRSLIMMSNAIMCRGIRLFESQQRKEELVFKIGACICMAIGVVAGIAVFQAGCPIVFSAFCFIVTGGISFAIFGIGCMAWQLLF